MSDEHHDYRGYAGQVAGGVWRAGDDVLVLPSGLRTRVASVDMADGPIDEATPGMSVTIRLEDQIDVPRGDMLVDPDDQPVTARALEATLCWMSERPLQPGARFGVKHTTRTVRAVVDGIDGVVDMDTLELGDATEMKLNDIGRVRLRLSAPLMVDPYDVNRATGAFILVDEATNDTVAAGMVRSALDVVRGARARGRWRRRAAHHVPRSGIDEAAVLIEVGAVLEGNAPGVPFRIAKAEPVSPTRPRRLRVEIEDVVESAYLVVGSVDHLLVFAVDCQCETAESIGCPPIPPFQERLGEEPQHDAVRALEHDVLGDTRRRFWPTELTIERGQPTDVPTAERNRADPHRQSHNRPSLRRTRPNFRVR